MAVGAIQQQGEGAVLGKPLETAAAWTAADVLAEPLRWRYELTASDVQEVLAATKHAVATGKPVLEITKADFPLPSLGPKLEAFLKNVVHGLGFQLIRGFPVDQLSRAEAVTAYYGLGTYWKGDKGRFLPQNGKGHVVGHIKSLGLGVEDVLADGTKARVYQTNAAQPWHVDLGDVVTLLCLQSGESGGLSRWVSSHTVYNELLKRRPDLVEVLAQDFYWDRRGEESSGEAPYWRAPQLLFKDGWFHFNFSDLVVKQAERFPEVPKLTPLQLEALVEVNKIAEDPAFHLTYQLQRGDLQLVSNFSVFHTRTAFEDKPDDRRHLLRLWIVPEDARPDSALIQSYPIRQGIIKAGAKPYAPLEAEE